MRSDDRNGRISQQGKRQVDTFRIVLLTLILVSLLSITASLILWHSLAAPTPNSPAFPPFPVSPVPPA